MAGFAEASIEQLTEAREAAKVKAERILTHARADGREALSPVEQRTVDVAVSDLRALDDRIERAHAELDRAGISNPSQTMQRLSAAANDPTRSRAMTSVNEPLTYQRGDKSKSYLRDLVRVSSNCDTTGESRSRLAAHAQDVEAPAYLEYRDLDRSDGSGGYSTPPAWLMSQYIELARPGRAFANAVQRQSLPGGTDSINIPKILTGTAVAVQQSDNQDIKDAGGEVDLTDTFINCPVRTLSGQQGLAIQLIDQSPIQFDDVVFRDLIAAHAAKVDIQTFSGTGINGQVLGVDNTPGIQTIPVTAVDIKGVYGAIANAIQLIHSKRFLPPDAVFMHPRRWGWFTSLLDDSQRPLVLPSTHGPMNIIATLADVASQQVVGNIQGVPIITDPNITTTAGAGNDEDVIYVARSSDIVLWESGIRARVLPETRAATLTVLLQIYNYLAFSAARYPQSVIEIVGLTEPIF